MFTLPKSTTKLFVRLILLGLVFYLSIMLQPVLYAQTVLVAACDSSQSSKNGADFVGDCEGDQKEINAAIKALPPTGGTVRLAEGTYDIRAAENFGGIVIDRSNVVLEGVGTSTRLLLADNQNVNVIRVTGDGIENVTIQRLYINGNSATNYTSDIEACGIKATTDGSKPMKNIVVQDTFIENSARLNVMLNGIGVRVLNNRLGDAQSDIAEILTGPGEFSNNYLVISGTSGYGLSTDAANSVIMSSNIIHVLKTGKITQSAFRFWGGRYRNVLANNILISDGVVTNAAELNGYFNTVTGNSFTVIWDARAKFIINSSSTVTGNTFANIDIVGQDTSRLNWPILIGHNFLYNTTITPTANTVESFNVKAP